MMAAKFSETLRSLKTSKQHISKNIKSIDLFLILDHFMYSAVDEIIDNSKYLDYALPQLLAWYSSQANRKISGIEKQELATLIFLFIISNNKTKKSLIRRMKLERSFWSKLINTWLLVASPVIKWFENPKQFLVHQADIYIVDRSLVVTGDLYSGYKNINYYYEQYIQFRYMIMSRYLRLVFNNTIKFSRTTNVNVEMEDLAQNYSIFVLKAIDKFDAFKGTITTYIQQWLQSGLTRSLEQEGGTAYSVPRCFRKNILEQRATPNNSVSLEEVTNLDEIPQEDHDEEVDYLRLLAKVVDPEGYGRILLGFEEVLNDQELMLLAASA